MRNKYIDNAFYVELLYEDLLTKIVLFTLDHFETRGTSQDLYEFISVLKEEFLDDFRDISFLRNDLFYINFFQVVRSITILD